MPNYPLGGYSEDHINEFKAAEQGVLVVNGLGRYFEDLDAKISSEYFDKIIKDGIKSRVEKYNFADTIAVHVRLGDYGTTSSWSTPIGWYGSLIDQMKRINPSLKFAIFSDGTDEQLQELTSREGVERVFFGNALADILAMGKCKVVIASNSTFSAWGAFLGQKPVLFRERLFGPVFADGSQLEYVLGDNPVLPNQIAEIVSR